MPGSPGCIDQHVYHGERCVDDPGQRGRVDAADSVLGRRRRVRSNGFDLARSPRLVEPGLQRTIEAEDGEPAFAGHGLDPVRRVSVWSNGTEVQIGRPVVTLDGPLL